MMILMWKDHSNEQDGDINGSRSNNKMGQNIKGRSSVSDETAVSETHDSNLSRVMNLINVLSCQSHKH